MKKRRVLALLLALSLAVSMNGMTVLATTPDGTVIPAVAGDDNSAVEDGEQAEDTHQPETSGEGAGSGGQDSEDPGEGETDPGLTDGSEGNVNDGDSPTDQEKPDGEPDEGDQTSQPSEDENGTGSTGENSDPEEKPDSDASEDTGIPEEGDLEEDPKESVSDNTLEEVPETAKPEVRMMTFTDDTGMRITYDANAEYDLTITNGVLEGITRDGSPVTGVVAIPENKGITAIGAAFRGNENITYVKLPKGVTTIQDDAFNNCYRLQGIYLPKELQTIGNSAFYRCTALLKVAVPKQVVSIGNAAFYEANQLFMIYMQDADYSSLTTIGDQAFYQCRALEHFCSDRGFIIPGRLETIGDFAFYGCKAITGVDFNESVRTIGESAFQECNSLKEVILSSKLSVIPKNAFAGCNGLLRLQLKIGNNTIGESAFKGCVKLSSVYIPGTVRTIENYAFADCSSLVAAEVVNFDVAYGDSVYPNTDTLTLRGPKGSTTEEYTYGKQIKFVAYDVDTGDHFYKYSVIYSGTGIGELQIRDAEGKDPNTLNGKKGVARGTKLYVYVNEEKNQDGVKVSRLVAGSIKCNGEPLKEEKGAEGQPSRLYYEMPIGGAVFTAEFENIASSKKIEGTDADVKVEISNGEVTERNGEVIRVNLKAGQYTRMFLTDAKADHKAVPSSKITFQSSKKAVATVSADGTIHAVKKGQTDITAQVTGGDEKLVTRIVRVNVESSGAKEIRLKASGYDTKIVNIETSQTDAVQVAVIDKNRLPKGGVKFQIKASIYDSEDDSISMALKWTSSDSKIAKLAKSSSAVDDPGNTVTIPEGVNGEATIRVTATNEDKKTITQKFIIRVIDVTPRLASANLTVNPNRTDGAVLQIIGAYGKAIDNDSVKFIKSVGGNKQNCLDFDLTYLKDDSDSTVSSFRVTAADPEMENGVHNVLVNINGGAYELPLKITVKTSKPNPKIAFEKKQPKINLFYANDETEVKVNVSNLGKDAVSDYELRPLSDKEDDKKFTENFEAEYVDRDTCVIRQSADNLKCNAKGKPVLTGYLRLYYEGYKETIHTDLKITIPAQRAAPAYKLNRTTDTLQKGGGEQEIELQLVDKKNQPVDLSEGGYVLSVIDDGESDTSPVQESGAVDIDDDGKFVLTLWGEVAGKVKLSLTNSLWAEDEKLNFTYTVKLTNSAPKISLTDGPGSTVALKSSTVNVNPNYPDQIIEFGLKSNQKGTVIAEEQVFEAKTTKKLADYYQYLDVQYVNGVGSVSISDPENIKDGTYTYVCDKVQYLFQDDERSANKVTLKIKVQRVNPTVTVKGSLMLNNTAKTFDGEYEERSELTLITKNLPDGYEFDIDGTELKCTNKNKSEYVDYFDWELMDRQIGEDGKITEGKLAASLNRYCAKGTYNFTIRPAYSGGGETLHAQKAVKFSVKVHEGAISITLSPKGKINLLDRVDKATASNSIIYTPSIKNLKDKVINARVFDCDPKTGGVDFEGTESDKFEARILEDGKIYVRPKEDAALKSNESYKVRIWMELENYKFPEYVIGGNGGMASKVLTIKTDQVLPKVTTDRSTVNLYLSNKNYVATFIVNKKDAKAIGNVESITFGEKDTNAQESFVTTEDEKDKPTVIESEQLDDGSLLVKLKLRDTVLYGCDTTNKITMYVRFEGQGTNTAGTAVTMNVKINK